MSMSMFVFMYPSTSNHGLRKFTEEFPLRLSVLSHVQYNHGIRSSDGALYNLLLPYPIGMEWPWKDMT